MVTGPVAYDAASGTATVEVQLRNVSDAVVLGPVRLRAEGGEGEGGGGEGREWSFEGRMGSHDRLPPGGLSEPVKVEADDGAGDGREAGLQGLRARWRVEGRRYAGHDPRGWRHFSPSKRLKSRSVVTHSHPLSIAMAAKYASETRLPFAAA